MNQFAFILPYMELPNVKKWICFYYSFTVINTEGLAVATCNTAKELPNTGTKLLDYTASIELI